MTDLSADSKRELLARLLRERTAREAAARKAATEGIPRLTSESERPLSFGQERLWFRRMLKRLSLGGER